MNLFASTLHAGRIARVAPDCPREGGGSRRLSPPLALALALVFSAAIASCRKGPSDPVRGLLDQAAAAAVDRDAGKLAKLLSPSFTGPGGMGKEEARATAARVLFGYESVQVSLSEVSAERGPDRARTAFRVRFSGAPKGGLGLEGLLPRSSEWRFAAVLSREGEGWRVSEASWERVGD